MNCPNCENPEYNSIEKRIIKLDKENKHYEPIFKQIKIVYCTDCFIMYVIEINNRW